MLILRGAPALSKFRQQGLLTELQALIPAVEGIYGEFMHFVNLHAELTADEQKQFSPQHNLTIRRSQ